MTIPPIPVPVGAILFEDKFLGAAGSPLNPDVWDCRDGHHDSQTGLLWKASACTLDGKGRARFVATRQPDGSYESGWARAAYGPAITGRRWVEARAKVPAGLGTYAAPIWDWPYPWGGPPSGAPSTWRGLEIDICEQLGMEPDDYHATLHLWDRVGNDVAKSGGKIQTGVTLASAMHYYSAAIFPDRVDFYFDRVLKATRYAKDLGVGDLTVYPVCANIWLNMGGSWAGASTLDKAVQLVDYYRVRAIA